MHRITFRLTHVKQWPHIEETDHPLERSFQGLAIGAATMVIVLLLLNLTATLQDMAIVHIMQLQAAALSV